MKRKFVKRNKDKKKNKKNLDKKTSKDSTHEISHVEKLPKVQEVQIKIDKSTFQTTLEIIEFDFKIASKFELLCFQNFEGKKESKKSCKDLEYLVYPKHLYEECLFSK